MPDDIAVYMSASPPKHFMLNLTFCDRAEEVLEELEKHSFDVVAIDIRFPFGTVLPEGHESSKVLTGEILADHIHEKYPDQNIIMFHGAEQKETAADFTMPPPPPLK